MTAGAVGEPETPQRRCESLQHPHRRPRREDPPAGNPRWHL